MLKVSRKDVGFWNFSRPCTGREEKIMCYIPFSDRRLKNEERSFALFLKETEQRALFRKETEQNRYTYM